MYFYVEKLKPSQNVLLCREIKTQLEYVWL